MCYPCLLVVFNTLLSIIMVQLLSSYCPKTHSKVPSWGLFIIPDPPSWSIIPRTQSPKQILLCKGCVGCNSGEAAVKEKRKQGREEGRANGKRSLIKLLPDSHTRAHTHTADFSLWKFEILVSILHSLAVLIPFALQLCSSHWRWSVFPTLLTVCPDVCFPYIRILTSMKPADVHVLRDVSEGSASSPAHGIAMVPDGWDQRGGVLGPTWGLESNPAEVS